MLELAGEGLVHGPAHSSIGQEGGAVGSIIGLRSTDAVNGSHRGHHQFLAKALTHVGGIRSDLDRARHARDPGGAAAHARRDPRARAGLLPRARRLDAPAVVRGRRARHERDRRRRRADGDGQRVGAEALRHHRSHDQLLRRRREPDRLGAGEHEPRGRPGSCRSCFFIENNLYGVSTHVVGDHRRHSAVGPRPGVRHPVMACRRHGSARGAPRDERGRRAHALAAAARRSSRPRSTASSTRTARTRAARSATARRRRRRSGASATRCCAWPPRCRTLGLVDDDEVASVRAQAQDAMRAAVGELLEADPENAGKRRIQPDAVAGARVRRRRRARRRERARRRARRSTRRPSRRRMARRRSSSMPSPRCMGRRMEQDERIVVLGEDVHRLAGGTNGATKGLASTVPRPRARHADQRERVRRPRRRTWRWTAGSAPWWSSCTPTSCGWPPTRSSTRSARRGTCSAA